MSKWQSLSGGSSKTAPRHPRLLRQQVRRPALPGRTALVAPSRPQGRLPHTPTTPRASCIPPSSAATPSSSSSPSASTTCPKSSTKKASHGPIRNPLRRARHQKAATSSPSHLAQPTPRPRSRKRTRNQVGISAENHRRPAHRPSLRKGHRLPSKSPAKKFILTYRRPRERGSVLQTWPPNHPVRLRELDAPPVIRRPHANWDPTPDDEVERRFPLPPRLLDAIHTHIIPLKRLHWCSAIARRRNRMLRRSAAGRLM